MRLEYIKATILASDYESKILSNLGPYFLNNMSLFAAMSEC